MEATDDERREVARKLRKTQGIKAFVKSLGVDLNGDWFWTDVSRRVADLIDPTCEVEYAVVDDFPDVTTTTEYALSCGHEVEIIGSEPPCYCPICERKVIGDGR